MSILYTMSILLGSVACKIKEHHSKNQPWKRVCFSLPCLAPTGSSISGWKTSHWSHREALDWQEFSTGDLHFENHWRCEEENPAIRRFGSWRTTVDLWWSSVKRRSKSVGIQTWSWKHNSFGDANSCCINIFYIFSWYNWYMWKSWCLWTF